MIVSLHKHAYLPTFEQYCNETTLSAECMPTYEQYVAVLEGRLDESRLAALGDKAAQAALKVLRPIREVVLKIANDFKIGLGKVVAAFRDRDVFAFLRAIRFNLGALFRAFGELTALVRRGLFGIFEELAKTGVIQKLRRGAIAIDDLLSKYPLLKRVGGILIAALLAYMWLNMTFIGDFDYDFNWGDIVAALAGKWSIAELFLSPAGLLLITLFLTGPYISVPWLGSSMYNLWMAIFYTGYVKLKDNDMKVTAAIRSVFK